MVYDDQSHYLDFLRIFETEIKNITWYINFIILVTLIFLLYE